MSANQMKLLWSLTAAALLVMLLYLGNHLQSLMEVDENSTPGCVIDQGQCHVTLDSGQTLNIHLSPWPVLALQPSNFTIRAQGMRLNSAKMALTGKNMYMGIHQYAFNTTEQRNELAVTGTISVCTERVMHWRGRIDLDTDQGPKQVWFDFDVLQH